MKNFYEFHLIQNLHLISLFQVYIKGQAGWSTH